MTATAYAMSDFAGVRVPEDQGGCGEQHAATVGEDGYPRVECDSCAPVLVAGHYGFSAKPEGVPRTPDEAAYAEHQKRQADSANREVDSAMRRDWLRGQVAAKAPSLTEQITAMSAEERAALRDLLGGGEAEGKTPARKPAGTRAKT